MGFREKLHNITHKHEVYVRGEAAIAICSTRGPWGKAHIMYQPNRYIDPFPISLDQLERVFKGEPL